MPTSKYLLFFDFTQNPQREASVKADHLIKSGCPLVVQMPHFYIIANLTKKYDNIYN